MSACGIQQTEKRTFFDDTEYANIVGTLLIELLIHKQRL